jgi:hypothetical protein
MLGFIEAAEKPGSDLEKHAKAARKFLKLNPESKAPKPEALIHFMQMKKIIVEGCSTQEAGASRRASSSSSSSHLGASASEAPKAASKPTRKTAPKASPKTAEGGDAQASAEGSTKRKKKGGVARIADRIKKLKDKPEEDIWEHDVARLWTDRYMRAGSSKKRKRRKEEQKKHLETFEEI